MSGWRGILCAWAVLLGSLASGARAQSGDYERALTAYQATSYVEAEALWRAALNESGPQAPERASVLYDLGNVAFRRKQPLQAAAWYTASLRLAPRNADAWHNLELARREAGLEPADRGDLRATVARLLGALTIPESEHLALGVGALLALALVWEALRGGVVAKWASALLGVALLVALAPWTYRMATSAAAEAFVVQSDGAALHSEPREQAALIGRIAAASAVERIDAVPGWVRVREPRGSAGWVRADALVALDPPYDL